MSTPPRAPAPGFTGIVFVLLLVAVAGAVLGTSYIPQIQRRVSPGATEPPQAQPAPSPPPAAAPSPSPLPGPTFAPPPALQSEESTVIRVVEKVRPAVVNINTRAQVPTLLGVFPQEGAGSGVIVRDDGLILTNFHVIEGAQEITVTLLSGRKLPARVVGGDRFTDLAVIKVEAERRLPTVELGSSGALKVGQVAIAIGNPFGLGSSVTVGVLSALNRSIEISPNFIVQDLIQTDAAINPGNSGGALVDSAGRLIGINTAIVRQAQGIGFAIPVDIARAIMNQIITRGGVVRPALGVVLGGEIDPQVQQAYGLPVDHGVIVSEVTPGGPAQAAGIQPNDIIVAIDGREVRGINDLRRILFEKQPGDRVTVTIVRDGRRQDVSVRLTQLPQ